MAGEITKEAIIDDNVILILGAGDVNKVIPKIIEPFNFKSK